MKKISLPTNEKGSVILLAMIMLVLLTLLGMAVTRTSSIEVQVASNDNKATDCLYAAESADHYAIEVSPTWMTLNDFLTTDPLTAQVIIGYYDSNNDGIDDSVTYDLDGDDVDDVTFDMNGDGSNDALFDIDGDGINDKIEIRCIEDTGGTHTGNLSDAANSLPNMKHISIPPIGSGYSLKYFEVRKYGITGTASNGCSKVQVGAYKVFNKF
jgi:PilX N-terminal